MLVCNLRLVSQLCTIKECVPSCLPTSPPSIWQDTEKTLRPPSVEEKKKNADHVDTFMVKQTRRSTFQSYCTYDLLSADGHLVYKAEEERDCCGPQFDVRVRTLQGHDVLNLLLPSSACTWETQMQVISQRMLLGSIDKNWGSLSSSFTLLSPYGEPILKVKGPGWGGGFMSDANYEIISYQDRMPLGVITRVWRGIGKELFSPNDTYSLHFPLNLDVTVKALLVACAMYIDFLHYEQRNKS
ncbi:phospholipid scramblase 2-like [Pelodytes ibericus]